MHGWNGDLFAGRARAYGWRTIEIDGHDVAAIDAAYSEAIAADGPTMIVARTEKGHGVSFVADHEGWHGKAMSSEQAAQAIEELGGIRSLTITPASPPDVKPLTTGVGGQAPGTLTLTLPVVRPDVAVPVVELFLQ